MTHQPANTVKQWDLDTDHTLSVEIRVACNTYDSGNYITVRDAENGKVQIARHVVDELISVLQEAKVTH